MKLGVVASNKRIILATIFFLGWLSWSFASFQPKDGLSPRATVLLDGEWRFIQVDKARPWDAAPGDSDAWETVRIPHNYGHLEAQAGKENVRGPAWYRKMVDIPTDVRGKRLFVKFEAASLVADVWINGAYLGQHRGGFSAFTFEISNFIKPGQPNKLEVRTDNEAKPDIAPLSGDFTIFGGIYRPVHLIITDEACITPLDHGSPGVAILQTKVTKDEAVLDISTQVSYLASRADLRTNWPTISVLESLTGAAPESAKRTLRFTLFDADGNKVASDEQPIVIQPLVSPMYKQRVTVRRPRLWQGKADPYLYQAVIELTDGDVVTDRVTQSIGLRSYHVDPEKGFFLNGNYLKLHGVCLHQGMEDKGWAVTAEDEQRDIDLITEMGANAIRSVHYQHNDNFYALCDKAGILVWAEIPVVNDVGMHGTDPGLAFAQTTSEQIRDLIRQNINHASIFTWGLFNEVKPGGKDPHRDIRDFHILARGEDPTRPTIVAASHNWWPELNRITDWAGFNTYPYWYTGPETGFDEFRHIPLIPAFCVSEYGAGASVHQHQQNLTLSDKPKDTDGRWHPEEWQTYAHERIWKEIADRRFIWGSFIWQMFESCTWSRKEGDRDGINDKGLMTYDRAYKKDAFFFYKANWNPDPMIYITSRRHIYRGEANTPVRVYSNGSSVELKVNGKSHGARKTNGIRIAEWQEITLAPGANTIVVSAKWGDEVITDSCVWEFVPGLKEPREPLPLSHQHVSSDTHSLFDGVSLSGWKAADPTHADRWHVENGAITSGDGIAPIPVNTYLHTLAAFEDFEFSCLFKLSGDATKGLINSGIQYRSHVVDGTMVGYQADIGTGYWGDIYDEHRRGKLVGGDLSALRHILKEGDWNSYTIRVEGNRHQLFINGVKTCDYIERDMKIPKKGVIAVQIHSGGAAKVQFRDMTITPL